MSYNPNIPQSSDIPSQSQGEMLTNFQQLNTVFDVDHVPFNDSTTANRGKHDKSTYIELSANPATAADEMALYSKASGGNTRLFMRQEGSGTVIQLSGKDPSSGNTGTTFLPGGLILAWGRLTAVSGVGNVVANVTTLRQVTFSIEDSVGTSERAYITSVSSNSFTVSTSSGNNVILRYMAVGI